MWSLTSDGICTGILKITESRHFFWEPFFVPKHGLIPCAQNWIRCPPCTPRAADEDSIISTFPPLLKLLLYRVSFLLCTSCEHFTFDFKVKDSAKKGQKEGEKEKEKKNPQLIGTSSFLSEKEQRWKMVYFKTEKN